MLECQATDRRSVYAAVGACIAQNASVVIWVDGMHATAPKTKTAGVILAAGASTRMGRPKQLLILDGQPLLQRVLQAALASNLDQVVLVLGHRAADIRRTLGAAADPRRLHVVVNPDYQNGMAGSLKTGVRAAMAGHSGVMILLADHPFLNTALINQVLRAFLTSDKAICAPVYNGRRGHPVCLERRFFADILSLSGDVGARDILRRHADQVQTIQLTDGRAFMDIDTPADLRKLHAAGCRHPD